MSCRFCSQHNCNCQSLITKVIPEGGRLCNQVIKKLSASILAEKIDLYIEYIDIEKIVRLGVPLFIGKNIYSDKIILTDDNYMEIFNNNININFEPNQCYFQTREISQLIYDKLRTEVYKTSIISKNPFNTRYNINNDCFIYLGSQFIIN